MSTTPIATDPPTGRAAELIRALGLQAHPEGGFYRELFRSTRAVTTAGARGARTALTSIDFLLLPGQFSAWHRVASDEVWHLLEGGPLRLWVMPATLDRIVAIELGTVQAGVAPRHIVPAGSWQAAEPLEGFAYCGATVGPGFEFADFGFLRDAPEAVDAVQRLRPELLRLR